MATLTLKKKNTPTEGGAHGERRQPLRGKGVARPRQTLAQAQAEREQREADFQARRQAEAEQPRRAESRPAKPGPKSGPKSGPNSGPRSGPKSGPWAGSPGGARPDPRHRDDARGAAPERERGPGRPARGPDAGAAPGRFRTEAGERGAQAPRSRPFRDETGGDRPRSASGPRAGFREEGGYPPPDRAPRQDQRRQTALRNDAGPRAEPRPRTERSSEAEGERLSKRMGELGLASRREADEWISAGWVRVDGRLAVLGQRVGPEVRIEIDPAAHKEQAKRVTILLHKPIGYVSGQAEDGYEPASVLIRSENHWKDDPSGIKYHIGHSRSLAPAGRLDIDSTGLLVLTQDGRVAKQLIGDESSIEKEYLVRVEYVGIQGVKHESGQLPEEALALLNHGLMLDDVQLKPAKVSWANEDQLRFVLREGRKRQIRRMCELVGLKVTALKRVRIGRIPLGHLPPGQWRFLSPWERFD